MSWPIIWPPTNSKSGVDPEVIEYAEVLARRALHILTAGRLGGETITVKPFRDCMWQKGYYWGSRFFWGYPSAYHLKRGVSLARNLIELEGPVGDIVSVVNDGVVLDPTTYRVEDGRYLVRADERDWSGPTRDDLEITYFRGYKVDVAGQVVTGVLAEEFLKAVTGGRKCRLPNNLTMVTRSGASYTMSTELFPNNATGITEVDTYVYSINPNMLKVAPAVYSPDLHKNRRIG